MGIICMNARCKKILELLLNGEEHIPLQRIEDDTKVSRRSIYYDLCKINEWLSFYHIPEIEVERRKGILIPKDDKKRIEEIVKTKDVKENYVFSPMERVKIIICYIIHLGEPVYIEQLSEFCQVSRNTIFNDLRVVVNQLNKYNLSLKYESKKGYQIEGDVIRVRALFFLYFNMLLPLFDSGVLNFIDREEIHQHFNKLKMIEKRLNTEYVDGILLSLAALLPLIYMDMDKPYFLNLRREEIVRCQEFGLICEYFPDLDESEQIYLCIHLLGSRVAIAGNEMFDEPADQTVYEITKALVAEFEKTACVIFEDREELERALFLHISTSLYRYQYGIQIGNPMSDDVIREYANLVDITKLVCRYLSRLVGLPIPDSEVAYLALHFGAHLKIASSSNERLRILIVCVNGVATGNMIKREVQKLLPYARIVDVVAAVKLVNIQNICDLVITTVKINSLVPVIVVHPIITNLDRKAILNHSRVSLKQEIDESEVFFDIIKKYVKKEQHSALKQELANYYQDSISKIDMGLEEKAPGLMEFLEKDRICITGDSYTWQESIRFAAKTLLVSGSIQKRYQDTIISQIQYYGPYMFILDGLVLAHAKPEDGVNQLDISMTIFQKPVVFSKLQEAQIIITLATEDQEKHLKILKDIMVIFADDKEYRVDELVKLKNEKDILAYLMKHLEEEAL